MICSPQSPVSEQLPNSAGFILLAGCIFFFFNPHTFFLLDLDFSFLSLSVTTESGSERDLPAFKNKVQQQMYL